MNNYFVPFCTLFIAGTQTTPPPMPPSPAPSNNVTSSVPLPPAYAGTTSKTKTVTSKKQQPAQISESSRNSATTQGIYFIVLSIITKVIKGAHNIFVSFFYNVNQKSMSSRINFRCKTRFKCSSRGNSGGFRGIAHLSE